MKSIFLGKQLVRMADWSDIRVKSWAALRETTDQSGPNEWSRRRRRLKSKEIQRGKGEVGIDSNYRASYMAYRAFPSVFPSFFLDLLFLLIYVSVAKTSNISFSWTRCQPSWVGSTQTGEHTCCVSIAHKSKRRPKGLMTARESPSLLLRRFPLGVQHKHDWYFLSIDLCVCRQLLFSSTIKRTTIQVSIILALNQVLHLNELVILLWLQ